MQDTLRSDPGPCIHDISCNCLQVRWSAWACENHATGHSHPESNHRLAGVRRPGAKGFEDAERGLWRMRVPPGAESSRPYLDPKHDPDAATPLPNVAPCLDGCGALGAPAQALARDGRGEVGGAAASPDVDLARVLGTDAARRQGEVVGYWRMHSTLTHVVIRNAGHMVPHDRPLVAQA